MCATAPRCVVVARGRRAVCSVPAIDLLGALPGGGAAPRPRGRRVYTATARRATARRAIALAHPHTYTPHAPTNTHGTAHALALARPALPARRMAPPLYAVHDAALDDAYWIVECPCGVDGVDAQRRRPSVGPSGGHGHGDTDGGGGGGNSSGSISGHDDAAALVCARRAGGGAFRAIAVGPGADGAAAAGLPASANVRRRMVARAVLGRCALPLGHVLVLATGAAPVGPLLGTPEGIVYRITAVELLSLEPSSASRRTAVPGPVTGPGAATECPADTSERSPDADANTNGLDDDNDTDDHEDETDAGTSGRARTASAQREHAAETGASVRALRTAHRAAADAPHAPLHGGWRASWRRSACACIVGCARRFARSCAVAISTLRTDHRPHSALDCCNRCSTHSSTLRQRLWPMRRLSSERCRAPMRGSSGIAPWWRRCSSRRSWCAL